MSIFIGIPILEGWPGGDLESFVSPRYPSQIASQLATYNFCAVQYARVRAPLPIAGLSNLIAFPDRVPHRPIDGPP